MVKEALLELEIIKQRCRGNQRALDRLQRKVEQARTRLPQDLRPQVRGQRAKGVGSKGEGSNGKGNNNDYGIGHLLRTYPVIVCPRHFAMIH